MKYFMSAWGVFTFVREVSVSDRIRTYRYYPLVGILIGSFFVFLRRVLPIFISSIFIIDLIIITMLVLVMFPRTVTVALRALKGLSFGGVYIFLWYCAITALYLAIAPPLKEIALVLMLGLACWGYLLVLICHEDSEDRPNLEEMSWATFPILLLSLLCWPLGIFLFLGTLLILVVFSKGFKILSQRTLASLSVMITELIVLIFIFVYHQALYYLAR